MSVELIQIPEEFRGVIQVADKRIAVLLMAWARGGNFDLGFLLRSVYLQGMNDAIDAEVKRVKSLRRVRGGSDEH